MIFAVGSESVILPTVLTALSFPLGWFYGGLSLHTQYQSFPEIGVVVLSAVLCGLFFTRQPPTSVWCRQLQCHLCWVFRLSYFHVWVFSVAVLVGVLLLLCLSQTNIEKRSFEKI